MLLTTHVFGTLMVNHKWTCCCVGKEKPLCIQKQ